MKSFLVSWALVLIHVRVWSCYKTGWRSRALCLIAWAFMMKINKFFELRKIPWSHWHLNFFLQNGYWRISYENSKVVQVWSLWLCIWFRQSQNVSSNKVAYDEGKRLQLSTLWTIFKWKQICCDGSYQTKSFSNVSL